MVLPHLTGLSNDKVIATRIANIGEKRQSGCEFGSPPAKGDATDPRSVKDDATVTTGVFSGRSLSPNRLRINREVPPRS